MVVRAEHDLSTLRPFSVEQRREHVEFAAALLALACEEGAFTACQTAARTIRVAKIALSYDPPVDGLPESATPDGAARFGLRSLPLSREEALASAEKRREESEDDPEAAEALDRAGWEALQDIDLVLVKLPWIVDRILDRELADEVRSWIELRPQLL
ncbi:hypothetical protein [Actinosynnema sp. NPDC020468]|uniref:hypothetical protein n=1 Tax=Actinosynnema sp. NPDC020468 TaxID=3154488 RepID=UPI00340DAC15